MNSNIQIFTKLRDQSFAEIIERLNGHDITHFEKNAFTAFVVGASHAAEIYFSFDRSPFKNIKYIQDFDVAMQAYVFLCLVEMYEFFRIFEKKEEYKNVMNVSKEKIIKDFCKIFGGEDIEKYTEQTLVFFDEIENKMNDPRDLWYNQVICFGKLLSNNEVDFEKITEENLAIKLDLSMAVQRVQIENAEMFRKIILGKNV